MAITSSAAPRTDATPDSVVSRGAGAPTVLSPVPESRGTIDKTPTLESGGDALAIEGVMDTSLVGSGCIQE